MDRIVLGRDREQATIRRALTGAGEGRGELLLACGEAGIGKSTLARWAAQTAAAAGAGVHWGICWETGGAPAYWPWVQVMRSIFSTGARTRDPEVPPALAPLLPELFNQPLDEAVLQAEHRRFQLLEALCQVLARASEGGPLLILLEDLHAADVDTLQVLQFLAPRLSGLPLVIFGTFRDTDARLAGSADALWQAARSGGVMRLPGLQLPDVAALARRLRGADLSAGDLSLLIDTTDGNPFFLTELLQHDTGGGPPDGVGQLIAGQLALLPEASAGLLRAAAVIGRSFNREDLAALVDRDAVEVERLLQDACALGYIELGESGRRRFSHVLYRDVIHAGTAVAERAEMHRRYARYLRNLAERGQTHRWQELALHLERSGTAAGEERVTAWQEAGRYARRVSAIADAVQCQQRALDALGCDPGISREMRCDLLLELADSTLVMGDAESGFQHCREAFRLARSAADSRRMAAAALTFGGVYVAASINDELVSMLEVTLRSLPQDALADRAQVSARLAAARQPAADPNQPMAQAREAIALARCCDDDTVLLATLRSAISALMDLAPAVERRALNQEYIALAECSQNPVESFRGHSRLFIDAAELGDGAGFDAAVAACERLAGQLGLPHYRWRVASAQAMGSLLRGDTGGAREYLQLAGELARRCDDPASHLPLALQALALVGAEEEPGEAAVASAVAEVEQALTRFPSAAIFVRPWLQNFQYERGVRIPPEAELSSDEIDALFACGDAYTIAMAGRISIRRKDHALCQRAYRALLPLRRQCSHTGLMGMVWGAPVALELARFARYIGEEQAVADHLARAQVLARQMRAMPVLRMIADFDRPAAQPESPLAGRSRITLVKQGQLWKVEFDAGSVMLKDSRGLQLLSKLLQQPDREIHVLDLVGGARREEGDQSTGAPLDAEAKAAYQSRLGVLREQLEEAGELGDVGTAEQARQEIDFITRELSRAFGLGGRARHTGSDAERARVNVQRRIKDAIRRIGEQLPDAQRYLEGAVETGTYCRYRPW